MKNKFIIVEGELDKKLLEAILPTQLGNVELLSSGGYSAALSKASTVLSYLHQNTLLLLDADTTNERAVAEKEQFVNDYLKSSLTGSQFKLILFKPSLPDRLIDFNSPFTDESKMLKRNMDVTRLWRRLKTNPSSFTEYQKLPEIEAIINFTQG